MTIYDDMPLMKQIREESGEIDLTGLFTAVFYRLMRDEVVPGAMEGIVQDILAAHNNHDPIGYSNGWLALYAKNIVDRLTYIDLESPPEKYATK